MNTSSRDNAKTRFVRWITELNLFESNVTDDHNIKIQRRHTRFYIITLSFFLFTVSIYVSLQVITQHIEKEHPTFHWYDKLQEKHEIKCFCSNVSIPYEEFIQLDVSYHQVCSSDFVTQRWIDYLYNPKRTPFYFAEDFRATASQQFQLLAILCRLSIEATDEGLRSFNKTKLVSTELFSKDLLDIEIQTAMNTFRKNLISNFNYSLMVVRQLIISNSLLPATESFSNFQIRPPDDKPWLPFLVPYCFYHIDNFCCYCSINPTCKAHAGFFGDELYGKNNGGSIYAYLDVVDGWYIACLPIYSLLFSTLKSFYNQTTIDSLSLFFINSSGNFKCLDSNKSTIFDPTDTNLETIVQANFIENLTHNITYSSYFNICAPKSCSYKISKRFNILYIINMMLGVYGGLSVVLRFAIPMIINFLIRWQHGTSEPGDTSNWLHKLFRTLRQLNLFKSAIYVQVSDIYKQR